MMYSIILVKVVMARTVPVKIGDGVGVYFGETSEEIEIQFDDEGLDDLCMGTHAYHVRVVVEVVGPGGSGGGSG